MKASRITFKFICFKTPWNGLENVPKRFYLQLKFFTFQTVYTDMLKMRNPQELEGRDDIRAN